MDTSYSVRKFVLIKGCKIRQTALSPFLLFFQFRHIQKMNIIYNFEVYTYFFNFLRPNPCSIMYVWSYFQTWHF